MSQASTQVPMVSSLPAKHAGTETIPSACMADLLPSCTTTTSTSPCKEKKSPSVSSYASSDMVNSTELRLEPERPPFDRANCQISFRRSNMGASPSSWQTARDGLSLQDVNDLIIKEVPNALVTHVCERTSPEASTMTRISTSHDFGKAFRNSSPSFILVHNSKRSANLTIEMLKKQAGQCDGVVIVVLIQQDATADFHPIVKKVPGFVACGADDVVVIPLSTSNINFTIAAGLAKAKASRDKKMHLVKQSRASMNQCQGLFWKNAHSYIPGFPKLQPQLREVSERRVANMVFVRMLGKGRYGSVHQCVDEMDNTCSAVKVFVKDGILSARHATQIANEISLLQRLNHKKVITCLGAAHSVHCVYLFMELAVPMNLLCLMHAEAAEGLPWSCAVGLFSQIAAGVAHCHKMQVAHCDLKLENVVLSKSGCAKIVDLGQAVDLSKDVAPLQGPFGTMPFTAPEIMCFCTHWDPPAADMWSLGVIAMELLCGIDALVDLLGWRSLGRELWNPLSLSHRANELKELFSKGETDAHGDTIMAISRLCYDVPPPPLMELLGKMLEFIPEERIFSETAARRSEDISTWNPSRKRS